jgi:predicted metal-dependent peptidase
MGNEQTQGADGDLIFAAGVPDADAKELNDNVREKVEDAARRAGVGSGLSEKGVEPFNVRADWQNLIKGRLNSVIAQRAYGFDQTTYNKFNRKMSAVTDSCGVIFPARHSFKQVFRVLFIFDTSGSMWNDARMVLSHYFGLLNFYKNDPEVEIITDLLQVDTQVVLEARNISDTYEVPMHINGLGGTDMRTGFVRAREIEREDKFKYDTILVATDGYTPWNYPEEEARTLVLLTERVQCPYKCALLQRSGIQVINE